MKTSPVCKDLDDFKKKMQDMKNTLLLQAICDGQADCVEEVLHEGADVNASDTSLENTTLFMMDCLRQFDVNVDDFTVHEQLYTTFLGDPAICIAIFHEKLNCLEALIKAGADVNSTSCYYDTPLMFAARYGVSIDFIGVLIKAGVDVNGENTINRVATCQGKVREKQNFLQVRELSGNFEKMSGNFGHLTNVREMSGNFVMTSKFF